MPTTNPSTLNPNPSLAALYYNPALSLWLSVDPLSDKYPNLSPYVYCANNPVVMKDEDGRDYEAVVDDEKKTITIRANFVVLNDGDNVEKVQAAVNEWNAVSGKYQLNAKKNGDYTVNFDLTVETIEDYDQFSNYFPRDIIDNKIDFVGALPDENGRRVFGENTSANDANKGKSFNSISIGIGRHRTIMHEIGHSLGLGDGNGIMEQGLVGDREIHSGHISTILVGARIFSSSSKSNPYLPNQVRSTSVPNLINKKGFIVQKKY